MNETFISSQLLNRLSEVHVADADPIRVIISFRQNELRKDFVDVASSPLTLIERYNLAVSEVVRNSIVTIAAVAEKPKEMTSINAVSTSLPAGVIKALSDKGDDLGILPGGIELDFHVKIALDNVRQQTGAADVQADGLSGKTVRVAVIDTGVDASHPDLTDRIGQAKDFTGEGGGDKHGHGTHVAGIICGEGNLLAGKYRGIAPGATLVDVKVLGKNGGGSASTVIAGIEWMVTQQVHIANLSIEGPPSDGSDALSRAANWAGGQGIVVCAAAGNNGPAPGTIGSPGAAPDVITVGAVDQAGNIADYSARDTAGNPNAKPDIVLHGTVVSCKPVTVDDPQTVDMDYRRDSGTSMACPQAAGFCALLLETYPNLSSAQLKDLLRQTAVDLHQPPEAQGAGLANVAQALAALRAVDQPAPETPEIPMVDGPVAPEPSVPSDEPAIPEVPEAPTPSPPPETPTGPVQPCTSLETCADGGIRIDGVVAEVGVRANSIGRLRIALKNETQARMTSVTARLRIDTPHVTMMEDHGDYGALDPGESDDAAYLVEFGDLANSELPCKLTVHLRQNRKRYQRTIEAVIPLDSVTTARMRDLPTVLFERFPDLQQKTSVTEFINTRGLRKAGLSPCGDYRYIVDAGGGGFLLIDANGKVAGPASDSSNLGVDKAAQQAQLHTQAEFQVRQTPEVEAIWPALDRDGTPLWLVCVGLYRESIRYRLKITIDGMQGRVVDSLAESVSLA